jgi:hypothetical protein
MLCPSVRVVMVNHHCVLCVEWSRYAAVEGVLWLGECAQCSILELAATSGG